MAGTWPVEFGPGYTRMVGTKPTATAGRSLAANARKAIAKSLPGDFENPRGHDQAHPRITKKAKTPET